jgi:phage shock protein PspC (stress-responsive transcriptional regulator)
MPGMPELPAPTARPRHGRWLGGVCAGLARRWGVTPARVRLGFLLGSLAFGLGGLAYVAGWLILPSEGEDGATAGQRGIVALAQVIGALLGLVALAAVGAVATVFGYGGVIAGVAGMVLLATLVGWARLGPAWALLPIGALTLPSVALAVGGVHVDPSTTPVQVTPRTSGQLAREYRSGLGLLTLDLRRTQLPAAGTIDVKIDAGVRRTLVALPHDRCVHVQVRRHDMPILLRAGALLVGRGDVGTPDAVVFGGYGDYPQDRAARTPGPTLVIDFSSVGGGLVVRDYPDDVDPEAQPDWPGYPVYVEAKPDTTGLPKRTAKRLVRAWRSRRAAEERSKRQIDRLMDGPCVVTAKPAKAKPAKHAAKQRAKSR